MFKLVTFVKIFFLGLVIGASGYLFKFGPMTRPIFIAGPERPHLPHISAGPLVYDQEYLLHHGRNSIKTQSEVIKESQYFQEDIPILMYHYIEEAPSSTKMAALYLKPEIFEDQLRAMQASHYNTIFASEAAKSLRDHRPLPARSVALTFDDGYEDFYDNVYPLLKKYDIKATLYVIINRIEQPGYINETELKELAASRFVEIGSHTFNHPLLKIGDTRQAQWEIRESRRALGNLIGRPILTFAYPFGSYNNEDVEIASSTGYLGSVTTDPGFHQDDHELQLLKRLRPDDRPGPLLVKWLDRIFQKNKK